MFAYIERSVRIRLSASLQRGQASNVLDEWIRHIRSDPDVLTVHPETWVESQRANGYTRSCVVAITFRTLEWYELFEFDATATEWCRWAECHFAAAAAWERHE